MRAEKMNDALQSTRKLRKISYRMLRKLHKLEKRRSLSCAKKLGEEWAPLLFVQHLSEIIDLCYMQDAINIPSVLSLKESLVGLTVFHKKRASIDRAVLVSCLKQHTAAFNDLFEQKIQVSISQVSLNLWRTRCLMAYVCQFGNNV